MKAQGGTKIKMHTFLNLALGGGLWLASHSIDTLLVAKHHSKYPTDERMDGYQSQSLQGNIPPILKQNPARKRNVSLRVYFI
jgi:hypothetical protein